MSWTREPESQGNSMRLKKEGKMLTILVQWQGAGGWIGGRYRPGPFQLELRKREIKEKVMVEVHVPTNMKEDISTSISYFGFI